MCNGRCALGMMGAMLAGALLSSRAGSQTPRPAGASPAATAPAGPAVQSAAAPAGAATQPAEFLALAEKAKGLKAVYAKGQADIEGGGEKVPAHLRQVEFEVWVKPPWVKQTVPAIRETRLSDGKCVYAFRDGPEPGGAGRRRQLRRENFYHALDRSAVLCDALDGYANLAAAVTFAPAAADPKHAGTFPDLAWFNLRPTTKPPHHLFLGTRSVRAGISPSDGLMRVLVGQLVQEGEQLTVMVVYKTVVSPAAPGPKDFLLPSAAAAAKWTDADSGEPIEAPKALIASPGP